MLQSTAKFPMKALGKVEVAGVEFAPGEALDALTKSSRDYLVAQGAAVDLSPTPDPVAAAPVSDATSDGSDKVAQEAVKPEPTK